MSFSSDVKNEIITNAGAESSCCARAEAAAMLMFGTTLRLSREGLALRLTNENPAVARRAFKLLKQVAGVRCEVSAIKRFRLDQKTLYALDMDASASTQLLKTLKLNREDSVLPSENLPEPLLARNCCKRSFLRGAFLATGTVTDPEKSYQLEITTSNEQTALELSELMKQLSLKAKTSLRKETFVIYLKESESVIDFLSMVGANTAVFRIENTRIMKNIHNNVNRAMNCEDANLNKTISAAAAQTRDIELIISAGQFPKLSRALRETAELRLEYSEASLEQLGEMHQPPQSKSCINHRLAKLRAMAAEIRKEIVDDQEGNDAEKA